MIRYLLSRTGCLMVIVGSILLMLGVAALQSDQPAFNFLLIGAVLCLIGFLLWQKLRQRKPRAKLFSLFRREDEDKEEKKRADDMWER